MTLTKTEYLLFLKHRAWLWLKKYAKEKLPPIDANTQAVFDAGNRLEAYAERLFPAGLHLGFNSYDEYESLSSRTQEAISSGRQILFQARFDASRLICLTDVVEFTSPATVKLYEIKSSTKVKPEHEFDLAFQMVVLEELGYTVESISVIHVNNAYVRSEEINPHELLTISDITESVQEKRVATKEHIEQALAVVDSTTMPDISPRHCRLNSMSDWLPIYRGLVEVPEYSIYDLASPNAQLIGELEDQDIALMKDIQDSTTLTAKQLAQVEAIKNNTHVIDTEKIQAFLRTLTYPHYFLDYETCSDVIPPYDGTKPYQQVPCQYSLHILDKPGGDLRHSEYIHRTADHPAKSLAETLRKDIGDSGSIIVWYANFETKCNRDMAEMVPEYAEFFHDLNTRTVDLMVPFSEGMYVDPRFLGSASIKSVLPVLVPDLSYKKLVVQEGQTAQRLWMKAVLEDKETTVENDKLFFDLLAYCELDTLAMVRIYEKLLTLG